MPNSEVKPRKLNITVKLIKCPPGRNVSLQACVAMACRMRLATVVLLTGGGPAPCDFAQNVLNANGFSADRIYTYMPPTERMICHHRHEDGNQNKARWSLSWDGVVYNPNPDDMVLSEGVPWFDLTQRLWRQKIPIDTSRRVGYA